MNRQKVLFVQKNNYEEFETESLWCIKDGDLFIIDNIPFVAKRIALGDKIKVEFDSDENAYYFDDFVEVSGNSTIRLYLDDAEIIEEIRKQLNAFGCESEVFLERKIIAVNVFKTINYTPIKKYLANGEDKSLWTYEESCLCHHF